MTRIGTKPPSFHSVQIPLKRERPFFRINLLRPQLEIDLHMSPQVMRQIYAERILDITKGFSPQDADLILNAYRMAREAFKGIRRRSGLPALEHLVGVAEIIHHKFKLKDANLIAAALLHDIIEDHPPTTTEDLRRKFGEEVASLVEGETKLPKGLFGEARQRESWKKWFEAMVEDLRVAILKLADNLHNMQDQENFPPKIACEHAVECREVYARVADILGMWRVRVQLEQLALRWLEPEFLETSRIYQENLAQTKPEVEAYLAGIERDFAQKGIQAQVLSVPVPLSEVFEEMKNRQLSLPELLELNPLYLNSIVILVKKGPDIPSVVTVVSFPQGMPIYNKIVNRLDKFKKPNGYEALHLYIPRIAGTLLVRTLTEKMHLRNEEGMLYYLRRAIQAPKRGYDWRKLLVSFFDRVPIGSDAEMLAAVGSFTSPIVAFTPKRKGVKLRRGSTVVDFAFEIHREIGLHAAYALVDSGKGAERLELFAPVPAGATVRIVTDPSINPNPDWLTHLHMPKAVDGVKKYLSTLPADQQLQLGREALDRYSKPYKTDWEAVSQVSFMQDFIFHFCRNHNLPNPNTTTADDLLRLVGQGTLDPEVLGDAFNQFYSAKLRERIGTGIFQKYSLEIKINHDRPGLMHGLTEVIANLKINFHKTSSHRNADGSATIAFTAAVFSSLQTAQIDNSVMEFLLSCGGGQVVKKRLSKSF